MALLTFIGILFIGCEKEALSSHSDESSLEQMIIDEDTEKFEGNNEGEIEEQELESRWLTVYRYTGNKRKRFFRTQYECVKLEGHVVACNGRATNKISWRRSCDCGTKPR